MIWDVLEKDSTEKKRRLKVSESNPKTDTQGGLACERLSRYDLSVCASTN